MDNLDAERLKSLRRLHNEVAGSDCDLCFLVAQIDSRDAALREARAEYRELNTIFHDQGDNLSWHVRELDRVKKNRREEIMRLRKTLADFRTTQASALTDALREARADRNRVRDDLLAAIREKDAEIACLRAAQPVPTISPELRDPPNLDDLIAKIPRRL